MRIRKAKIIDAEDISKLKNNTIEKINKEYNKKQLTVLKREYSIDNIKRNIENRKMFCLVERRDILGVIDLKEERIGGLFDRYDIIRKGFGKKLLDFIVSHAKKNGIRKVWLYSTLYAEKFYLKNGFRVVNRGHRINQGVRFPEIKMEKRFNEN
mgnify:CR=1 FL=1